MILLHSPTLVSDLSESSIFIDSTALITASKSKEFLNLLSDVAGSGCTLYTLPSVIYEYTRSANTIQGYKERLEFIGGLGIIVFNRVEELVEKDSRIFLTAYNRQFTNRNGERGPSYTDSLLCTMLYKHRSSDPYLLTANHKDVPTSIFDRKELITIEIADKLHTEALYKFSSTKFSKILDKLESEAQL